MLEKHLSLTDYTLLKAITIKYYLVAQYHQSINNKKAPYIK